LVHELDDQLRAMRRDDLKRVRARLGARIDDPRRDRTDAGLEDLALRRVERHQLRRAELAGIQVGEGVEIERGHEKHRRGILIVQQRVGRAEVFERRDFLFRRDRLQIVGRDDVEQQRPRGFHLQRFVHGDRPVDVLLRALRAHDHGAER
jgi:hypothetical protein